MHSTLTGPGWRRCHSSGTPAGCHGVADGVGSGLFDGYLSERQVLAVATFHGCGHERCRTSQAANFYCPKVVD